MAKSKKTQDDACSVKHIYAKVTFQPNEEREAILAEMRGKPDYEEWAAALLSRRQLRLRVILSAEDITGRRIDSQGYFDIGGPRRSVGAVWHRYHGPSLPAKYDDQIDFLQGTYNVAICDIEDSINMMLGRDPALRRPPRLAWTALLAALTQVGMNATEEDLIATPLTVDLDKDVQDELNRLTESP